jgi:hypothetical protein
VSVRNRRVLTAATAVLWVAWLLSEWAVLNPDIPTSDWQEVGSLFLRMLSVAATLAVIVTYLVSPILATARIWYIIGQRAQQDQCTCSERRATVTMLRSVRD